MQSSSSAKKRERERERERVRESEQEESRRRRRPGNRSQAAKNEDAYGQLRPAMNAEGKETPTAKRQYKMTKGHYKYEMTKRQYKMTKGQYKRRNKNGATKGQHKYLGVEADSVQDKIHTITTQCEMPVRC
jgi:hypothetical protein